MHTVTLHKHTPAVPPGTAFALRCVLEATLARPLTEGTRDGNGHHLPRLGTRLVDARVVCAPAAPRLPLPFMLVHTHAGEERRNGSREQVEWERLNARIN